MAPPTGPACPDTAADLSNEPLATAVDKIPELRTLASAISDAELTEVLNTSPDLTLFAPVDKAFDKIPQDERERTSADKEELLRLVSYHVALGRHSPDALDQATLDSLLQDAQLTTSREGDTIVVNGKAKVICGPIQTANATIYLIDTVLQPQ